MDVQNDDGKIFIEHLCEPDTRGWNVGMMGEQVKASGWIRKGLRD